MVVPVTAVNYLLWRAEGKDDPVFAAAFTIISIWVLGVQMPYRLRIVETEEEGLLTKRAGTEQFIPYSEMYWLTRFDVMCPWFITLRYKDNKSGRRRKIAYIPKDPFANMFRQDEMTTYIKERIREKSKYWDPKKEPVILRRFILLFLFGSPMLLVLFYFVKKWIEG